MSKFLEALTSAIGQVVLVLVVSLITYGFYRLFSKTKTSSTFFDYVGLKKTQGQFDKTYWLIFLAVVMFSSVSAYIQYHASDISRSILTGDSSPYGKILKDSFNLISLTIGAVYCFIQAGLSEEILFRGLIGRRLFNRFGMPIGNLIQALIFWVMHLLIVRFVLGEWFSWIQVHVFVVSFGFGLALGFVNFRKNGISIAPSWFLHSVGNFTTFLSLSLLMKF